MFKIIELSNIQKSYKRSANKKIVKLQDIYNNFLKTKA
jgi:hypothetical protein